MTEYTPSFHMLSGYLSVLSSLSLYCFANGWSVCVSVGRKGGSKEKRRKGVLERGREGEREGGREGERERGREGERECWRVGERE